MLRAMATAAKPPPSLDPAKLRRKLSVPAFRLPARVCSKALLHFRSNQFLLKIPRCPPVIPDNPALRVLWPPGYNTAPPAASAAAETPSGGDELKILLADPVTVSGGAESLPAETQALLRELGVLQVEPVDLELGVDSLSFEEVCATFMPPEVQIPNRFETAGHIAHFNLREEQLPYKHQIGEALLLKNKGLRTVVNKVDSISTKFRVFPMELLAGDPDYLCEVQSDGCRFQFDFRTVYWNSRLDTEHNRLCRTYFRPGDVVWDVMAGVGPFAVPAAKTHGCAVYANDLNPQSRRWLGHNIERNRVAEHVLPLCLDGRAAIRELGRRARGLLPPIAAAGANESGSAETPEEQRTVAPCDHVIMNLPASAIEFVDAFLGMYAEAEEPVPGFQEDDFTAGIQPEEAELIAGFQGSPDQFAKFLPKAQTRRREAAKEAKEAQPRPLNRRPVVHCYCFSSAEDVVQDVKNRIENMFPEELRSTLEWIDVYDVRTVAPFKEMMCGSFRLSEEILHHPGYQQNRQRLQKEAAAAAAAAREQESKKAEEEKGDGEQAKNENGDEDEKAAADDADVADSAAVGSKRRSQAQAAGEEQPAGKRQKEDASSSSAQP